MTGRGVQVAVRIQPGDRSEGCALVAAWDGTGPLVTIAVNDPTERTSAEVVSLTFESRAALASFAFAVCRAYTAFIQAERVTSSVEDDEPFWLTDHAKAA